MSKVCIPSRTPGPVHTRVEEVTVTFPEGLVGCEEWRHFTLIFDPHFAPLAILQSLDEPKRRFLAIDPKLVCPDYALQLTAADAAFLGAIFPETLQVLSILTVRSSPQDVTANLLGPLVINPASGLGKQFVLADSEYSPRHRIGPTPSPSVH